MVYMSYQCDVGLSIPMWGDGGSARIWYNSGRNQRIYWVGRRSYGRLLTNATVCNFVIVCIIAGGLWHISYSYPTLWEF